MKTLYTCETEDDPTLRSTPVLFLAGPTSRVTNSIPSWRVEAHSLIVQFGFEGLVVVPEFPPPKSNEQRNGRPTTEI